MDEDCHFSEFDPPIQRPAIPMLTPEQIAVREKSRRERPPENTVMADQIKKLREKFPDIGKR